MGYSHSVYTLDEEVTLGEAIEIAYSLYDHSINKEKAEFICQFKLSQLRCLNEIERDFPVLRSTSYRRFGFQFSDLAALNDLINEDSIYDRLSLFSKLGKKSDNSLSYNVQVPLEANKLFLELHLPKNDDVKLKSIYRVIEVLNRAEILSMQREEMEIVFPSLLMLNKSSKTKGWRFEKGFSVSGGDVFIRLEFNEKHLKKLGFSASVLAVIINSNLAHEIKGIDSFTGWLDTHSIDLFVTKTAAWEEEEVSTNMVIDLSRLDQFGFEKLLVKEYVVGHKLIELERLILSQSSSFSDSVAVNLCIEENSWQFELHLNKYENDKVLPQVEDIIGRNLEFKEWI